MNCPRCQMLIANPDAAVCPHCGYALRPPEQPSPSDALTPSAPQTADAPFAPPAYPAPIPPQMPMGPYPSYGAPPSGSLYNPEMAPYTPYSPYQPYPMYPPYGAPVPATTPFALYPAWTPAPPAPPRRNGMLVSVIILLAVALIAASGAAVYLAIGQRSGPAANVPSVAATATTTPTFSVIFQDPLTSNVNGWANDTHCSFSGGSYHVKDGYVCFAPMGSPVADGEISVQVRQVAGQTRWFYGLLLRRTGSGVSGDAYAFVITSNGYWSFATFVNRQRTDNRPPHGTSALREGLNVSNTLDVRMIGPNFTFYINGQMVGQATDTTYSSGGVGVLGNPEGGVEVAFNNIKVSVAE